MKKYILIASAALLALAACTKVQEAASQQEISFQVANHVQTKADGNDAAAKPGEFPKDVNFGTYAWHHAGETVTPFMENEKVGLKGSEWKTLDRSFFWPKTGSVNFVSYAPYEEKGGPTVAEQSIAYKAVTVSDVDLMYADRALEQSANVTTYYYNGVPTLFHHALAKLSFRVKANFLEAETTVEDPAATANDAANTKKSVTKWEVTLYNVTLKGHYETGDLSLSVDPRESAKWQLPEVGQEKFHIWTPDTQKTAKDVVLFNAENGEVLTTTPKELYDGKSFFVLPQALADKAQQLSVKLHIKTTQPNDIVQEEDYTATLDLKGISSLKAWQMNQNIVYTIGIKPTAAFDPNKPDEATDAVITFDPTLADWEIVKADAIIQL